LRFDWGGENDRQKSCCDESQRFFTDFTKAAISSSSFGTTGMFGSL
jgi:hypothetical protein